MLANIIKLINIYLLLIIVSQLTSWVLSAWVVLTLLLITACYIGYALIDTVYVWYRDWTVEEVNKDTLSRETLRHLVARDWCWFIWVEQMSVCDTVRLLILLTEDSDDYILYLPVAYQMLGLIISSRYRQFVAAFYSVQVKMKL